jgi:hypothetical protein
MMKDISRTKIVAGGVATLSLVGIAYLIAKKDEELAPGETVAQKASKVGKAKKMGAGEPAEIVSSFPYKKGLILYQYPMSKDVSIQALIKFPVLLRWNDISKMVYTSTLPFMGLASDVSSGLDAVAVLKGLTPSVKKSAANRALIEDLIGNDPASLIPKTKETLGCVLEAIAHAVIRFEENVGSDNLEFQGVRRQRIWANVLWTLCNSVARKRDLGMKTSADFVGIEILSANDIALFQKPTPLVLAFVEAFLKGAFNCEISEADSFFIFSSPSLEIPNKAMPSETYDAEGDKKLFLPRKMEPAWVDGIVFYSEAT